jgi:hypothetical protein
VFDCVNVRPYFPCAVFNVVATLASPELSVLYAYVASLGDTQGLSSFVAKEAVVATKEINLPAPRASAGTTAFGVLYSSSKLNRPLGILLVGSWLLVNTLFGVPVY